MISAGIIYLFLAWTFGWRLERFPHDWLEIKLRGIQDKTGATLFCILLSFVFLLFAVVYITPDTGCHVLGMWYAKLAENPFDFVTVNEVGFRRLTPAISYFLGLRGELILITNFLFAWAVLFSVAKYGITRSEHISTAFFAVAALAFSLVTFTTLHCGGYTDSTTYLLILLMWWFRRNGLLFYLFFLFGLLNRESVLFLLPWFIFLRWQQRKSWVVLADLAIGFGVVLTAYSYYRDWVAAQTAVKYSSAYYLVPFLKDPFGMFWYTFPWHGLGAFSVFKLLWIFPVLACVAYLQERKWAELVGCSFLFIGTYLQMFFAADTSRMMTLGFMIMPIALLFLWQENRFRIRSWIGWVFLANLAVPILYTAGNKIEVWPPLWRSVLIAITK